MPCAPGALRRANIIPNPNGFEMQTHTNAFCMPTVAKPLNCILVRVSCLHTICNIPFLAANDSRGLTRQASQPTQRGADWPDTRKVRTRWFRAFFISALWNTCTLVWTHMHNWWTLMSWINHNTWELGVNDELWKIQIQFYKIQYSAKVWSFQSFKKSILSSPRLH